MCGGWGGFVWPLGDTVESLVEVPKTEKPYIVLENMMRDSHQATRCPKRGYNT